MPRKRKTNRRRLERVSVRAELRSEPDWDRFAWALLQPWRLTLVHPHGQGFWWLLAEPPLYVVLVGVLFRWVIAPGLVADLEADQ